MTGWRITTGGRIVLALLVAGVAAAFLAPSPWDGIGSVLAGLLVLGWAMDTFAGGTRGGYYRRTPGSEAERVALFRRMYRPRGR
jgi:hypothetical protein